MFTQKLPSLRKSFAGRQSGFSLVEVVLAVGVVAFAFVAILGLIPAGLHQFRQAMDTSVCAQIAQRVIMDAQQTDFNTLIDYKNTNTLITTNAAFYFRAPTYSAPTLRYFDEEGNEIIAAGSGGTLTKAQLPSLVYCVNTRIMAAQQLPQPSSGTSAYTPTLATILVQVAFNPGNLPVPITPAAAVAPAMPLTFNTTSYPGVTVRNYSAQIGRNF